MVLCFKACSATCSMLRSHSEKRFSYSCGDRIAALAWHRLSTEPEAGACAGAKREGGGGGSGRPPRRHADRLWRESLPRARTFREGPPVNQQMPVSEGAVSNGAPAPVSSEGGLQHLCLLQCHRVPAPPRLQRRATRKRIRDTERALRQPLGSPVRETP